VLPGNGGAGRLGSLLGEQRPLLRGARFRQLPLDLRGFLSRSARGGGRSRPVAPFGTFASPLFAAHLRLGLAALAGFRAGGALLRAAPVAAPAAAAPAAGAAAGACAPAPCEGASPVAGSCCVVAPEAG
jgi:hypothetical protein